MTSQLHEYNALLQKYWGYPSLKDEQYTIISNILSGRDVCAILATGFGKSICYQLPTLISNKCVIVISPLIALMLEQSQDMRRRKIPTCVLNSTKSDKEKDEDKANILKYKTNTLIYMTPEYLLKSEYFLKQLSKQNNLLMVCIDEAHAVSTWGLDFRESYTKLTVLRDWIPSTPILTLTATATTKVKDDITKILRLDGPLEITGNFDRPNLSIHVKPRSEDILIDLGKLLNKYKNEYIIIYCKTRDETENLATSINDAGIKCEPYHAGLPDALRTSVQQDFIEGTIKCITATIAFGMGINIPNVRLIIHYNCPKNIESYYQEIGRAGRDGLPSECYLFYTNKDFQINRFFLKSITNQEHKSYQEEQIRLIEKYIYSTECRRKILLVNFGQRISSCTNCDNCTKTSATNYSKAIQFDYTKPIYILLNLIYKINNKFGMLTIINILLGNHKKIKEYLTKHDEFGVGLSFGDENWWRGLFRTLLTNDLILETQISGSFGISISLSNKGKQIRNKLTTRFPTYLDLITTIESLELDEDEDDSDEPSHYNNYKLMFDPIITIKPKSKSKSKTSKPRLIATDEDDLEQEITLRQVTKPKKVIKPKPASTTVSKAASTTVSKAASTTVSKAASKIASKTTSQTTFDADSIPSSFGKHSYQANLSDSLSNEELAEIDELDRLLSEN
ncbi:MAG: DEAD/SNF2-like helicase [Gaeavirus sp.]|uniref:DEAD/SNF2-like helicase n=1 Tax=Gaeavirus sp. TaxID=2487767 RepID=A0A3G5A380_9VIRU|nr:MAG: DEAD/SNF2-like helicase [Gaeavirus sp.]